MTTTLDLLIKNVSRGASTASPTPDAWTSGSRTARSSGSRPTSRPRRPPGSSTAGAGPAFPGVVDAHQHWGIYKPLAEDTDTESRAGAQGGVTTAINYMRTGAYYMNRGGPYAELFPEVLAAAEGRAYVDYGFHLAPIRKEHIDEMPS